MPPQKSTTEAGSPTVQAHRCFAGVAPENTVLAARTAVDRFDAAWLEVDVQPTDDGTVVCFHDSALDEREGSRGITDGVGAVRDLPTETVCSAEVLGSGHTVPRLAEFLNAVPVDVGVNVELKSPGSPVGKPDLRLDDESLAEQRELWAEFVTDVVDVLADEDRPLVFSSFFEGAIAAAAEHAPAIPRAVIVGTDLEAGRAVADRHDAVAINARSSLLLEAGAPFVTDAHEFGVAVNAWTVRDWTTCRDLASIGVDGVIADYPFLDATL